MSRVQRSPSSRSPGCTHKTLHYEVPVSMTSATSRDESAAPLRRDVRLLGSILGDVLVEQDGPELLAAVERVRLLAREAREGATAADVSAEIAALPSERQALVLRAFSLYFQLANIAEQHHRLRRRREYEHEGQAPRESLAEAIQLLGEADVEEAVQRLSVELVLTAHPAEATRRTVL